VSKKSLGKHRVSEEEKVADVCSVVRDNCALNFLSDFINTPIEKAHHKCARYECKVWDEKKVNKREKK
jgi:hypothetical protein